MGKANDGGSSDELSIRWNSNYNGELCQVTATRRTGHAFTLGRLSVLFELHCLVRQHYVTTPAEGRRPLAEVYRATQRGPVDIVQWQMSKSQKLSNRKTPKRKIAESKKRKSDN
jgi:hypothetical protein